MRSSTHTQAHTHMCVVFVYLEGLPWGQLIDKPNPPSLRAKETKGRQGNCRKQLEQTPKSAL